MRPSPVPSNRRGHPYRWVCAGVLATIGWIALVGGEQRATAHNPDTSYARWQITTDAVSAKLTYDITSLVRIHPQLDADGNHQLIAAELTSAAPSIEAFLRAHVEYEVDGQRVGLGELQPVNWPAQADAAIAERDYHAPTSLVTFEFHHATVQPVVDIWARFDLFETLGLRHTILGAFEHDGQTHELLFTAFEPDYLFETGYVPPLESPTAITTAATAPAAAQRRSSEQTVWSRLALFFEFGVEHILIGYDHILFLLSLIVVSRVGELVQIVTSFTVAHSITLALATLGWVDLSSQLVETSIAATIVYTAVENFWIRDTSGRWRLTFLFGLIHGFGFAGVLRDLDLPTEGFVRSLIAFNLGVEVGQLAIVAVLAAPAALLRRSKIGLWGQRVLSAVIAICGAGWLIDRACGLDIMPF